jgi:hypothetical protein
MKKPIGITVRLFGGLGNQLFQYVAGLDSSIKAGLPLKFDFSWINASYSQSISDISDFNFFSEANNRFKHESSIPKFKTERLKTKLASKSATAAKFFSLHSPTEPGFINLDGLKQGIKLRGYYQSYLYYDSLRKNSGPLDWSLKKASINFENAKRELEAKPFIALHVRGGDYLKKTNIYHKLEKAYYKEALKELKSTLGDIRVCVFSDDTQYAKKLFYGEPELEFFSQENLRASEAMLLMSSAQGIIIGNSTFSYWAAMINAGDYIYAPRFWFTNTEADKCLYPPGWNISKGFSSGSK